MEERKQALTLFGYRFFYVFLLGGIFYLCLGERMALREKTGLHLFVLAVLAAGICAVHSLKGTRYLYGFIGLLAVYAAAFWGWSSQGSVPDAEAEGYFWKELLYLMLLTLAVYLGHLAAERFVWIKRAGALLLPAGLVVAMISGWQVPRLGVAAVLLCVAAVLTEAIESGWKKQKQGSAAAYLMWLLPFLIGYFILVAVIPYKDTPYDWSPFVNLYYRVQRRALIMAEDVLRFGKEDFGISTTGFPEEKGMFGNLDSGSKVVMTLDNANGYGGGVYLTGKIYDSFDGRVWAQRAQGGENDHMLDILTTLCAVYDHEMEYAQDYLRERTLGVEYEYFHTGYLFAPVKTYWINMEDQKAKYDRQSGEFRFAKKQGMGTSYQITYLQPNLGNPVFEELVRSADANISQEAFERAWQEISEPVFQEMLRKSGGNISREALERARKEISMAKEEMSAAELAAYQERVRRDYTEKVALSPKAEDFLERAVAGADTEYEKLLCLESALSHFSYNKKPGKLPESVNTPEEFLDYFLLESREGYCSYYATAFVLLARAEGIPARYVQGYMVPLDGASTRKVTDEMAHAWPEAWLDGIGWIPFEPTPGFDAQRKISWDPEKEPEEEEIAGEAEEIQEAPGSSGTSWEEEFAKDLEERLKEAGIEQELEERLRREEIARRRERLITLGYFLLLIFSVGVLLLLTDALMERKRAAKRTAEEKFRLGVLENLQILSALGYRRRREETLSELNGRLKQKKIADTEAFLIVCEEVLYGDRVPDEEVQRQLLDTRKELLKVLKQKKGKAYLFSRIGLYLMRAR